MTKEQTYSQLLMAISTNEKKYDDLKASNEAKKQRVRELEILNENRTSVNKPDPDDEQACITYENQMSTLRAGKDDMQA